MTNDVQQLVNETIDLTGAAPPGLLDADAPVLSQAGPGEMYLIGLVGGKDVGKSSLVNAIVGMPISAPTSHGPGTEMVIAYAHESAAENLRELLDREVSGRYTIITHRVDRLARQVLLDLPDIDSRWSDHVQITRRMLRHMLYPLWIQSVEKYADRRPQELLAAVAEGNDPANFVFCLNKADQLASAEAAEIRDDFANRIARVLGLPQPPRVYLISATKPDQHDLPALREALSRGKSEDAVNAARGLAERRQDRSLLGWLEHQRLGERAEQLARLEHDAEEMLAARVALPLLDVAVPRILDDPGQRMAMVAPATRARLARWPIINALDALLWPLMALVQKNLAASPGGSADPDAYLDRSGAVSTSIQAAFAQLHQLHPELGTLYRDRKLWDSLPADLAAADLRRRFAAITDRQRQAVLHRAGRGSFSALWAPFRWLLTVGAVLWFPFIQPLLSVVLQENVLAFSRQTLLLIVQMLSVTHLLQCAAFLLIWFVFLWIVLRWGAQRRVQRIIERWKSADVDDELSLAGQTMQWIDEMIEPIRLRRHRVERVVQQARRLREALSGPGSAVRVPA